MNDHIKQLISELEQNALHPAQTVRKTMDQTGKKAIGCFPIYAPEELVYAAGMIPVGMWGGQTLTSSADKYYQGFCCSIMKINTEQAMKGHYDCLSGVLITAYCDTLKCTIENWKAALPEMTILPIVYPQNRKTAAGIKFCKEEFLRVLKELEKISGVIVSPERLTQCVDLYDRYRSAMQLFVTETPYHCTAIDALSRHLIIKASYFMDKEDYLNKIELLNEMLSREPRELNSNSRKIVLTGLISEPQGLLSIMAENELIIAGDDLAHESRQFRTISPRDGTGLDRMATRIALQDGCAFLYDCEKTRGKRLMQLVNDTAADGVVVCQMKFCDPEEFDYPIYKEELSDAKIPILYLELEQHMDSLEQLRTRIQSFAELLHL